MTIHSNNFSPGCQLKEFTFADMNEIPLNVHQMGNRTMDYVCTACPEGFDGDHCDKYVIPDNEHPMTPPTNALCSSLRFADVPMGILEIRWKLARRAHGAHATVAPAIQLPDAASSVRATQKGGTASAARMAIGVNR